MTDAIVTDNVMYSDLVVSFDAVRKSQSYSTFFEQRSNNRSFNMAILSNNALNFSGSLILSLKKTYLTLFLMGILCEFFESTSLWKELENPMNFKFLQYFSPLKSSRNLLYS